MNYYVEPSTKNFHIHKQESKDPGVFAHAHMHTYVELLWCISGEFRIRLNEKPYHLVQGDLIVVNTDTIHAVQALSNEKNAYHVIKFHPAFLYSLGQTETDMLYLQPFTLQNNYAKKLFTKAELEKTEIPSLLNAIIEENRLKKFGYDFSIKGLFERIVLFFMRYWKENTKTIQVNGISSAALEKCRSVLPILWEQYQSPPSAKDMAASCYMSYSGFANVFKQLTGQSYLGYIHFIRIIKAKEMLLTTKLSVTEIGQSIGFSTSSYFIEQFTKTQGITPGQYRKQAKHND